MDMDSGWWRRIHGPDGMAVWSPGPTVLREAGCCLNAGVVGGEGVGGGQGQGAALRASTHRHPPRGRV